MKRKMMSIVLSLALLFSLFAATTVMSYGAWGLPVSLNLLIDGESDVLHGYNVEGYDYFPLKDFAHALRNTEKAFAIEVTSDGPVNLAPGQPYPAEHTRFTSKTVRENTASFVTQNFYIGGVRYTYSVAKVDDEIFVRPADLAQLFDFLLVYNQVKGEAVIHTGKSFLTNFHEIAAEGYFDYLHGAIVGDLAGTDYYAINEDKPVAIASTTKIMTYLLVMEAIAEGVISTEDWVAVTAEAALISRTEDNVLESLEVGNTMPLVELLDVMMVVSSNEAATMLGEHVAGSEEAFVALMNKRAQELGLEEAVFYNPHGLPVYTKDVLSSKLQNRMTTAELMKLTRYVLSEYPQLIEITSKQTVMVTSSGGYTYNGGTTNRLLYQLDKVDGLKTGTTNRSGACQVATMLADPNDPDSERFIAIVLGAEDNLERYWKTGMLLQFADEMAAGRKPEVVYVSVSESNAPVSGNIEILFTDRMDEDTLSITLNGSPLTNGSISEDGKFFTASYSGLGYSSQNILSISGKSQLLESSMDVLAHEFTTIRRSSGSGGGGGSSAVKTEEPAVAGDDQVDLQAPAPAVAQFTDLASTDWYFDAIRFVVENGLFAGVGESEFGPQQTMTRAMFVTVLGRLAEQAGVETSGYSSSFADVVSGSWYSDYVGWAAANGIVSGYDAVTFGVDDSITREQMAVMFCQYAEQANIQLEKTGERTFADASQISSWAAFAVNQIAEAGLITGYEDGTFRPQQTATRAEVAVVFRSLVETYIKQ